MFHTDVRSTRCPIARAVWIVPATVAGALALMLAALAGCSAPSRARTSRVPVAVATVERREMPFAITSTGTVEALQSAAVGSQVGGVIVRVAFKEGSDVKAGQMLFQIDPRPFRATLEQAGATLSRSRAQSETARLEAGRARQLFEQDMLAEAEWDQKRAAAETWAATVRADSATMQSARLNLDFASIRAPISGSTGRLMVRQGDYVRPATAEPLVTINQTRPVRVRFTVPASAVPLVQKYRAANPRVIATGTADSSTVEGPLVFVDNAVDPASGTLLLKGEFPNRDGRLMPGQFVDVRLVLYVERGATVVPTLAIMNGQEGSFVYVVNADSTVATRPVEISRTVDEVAVLSQGLTAGEMVVTDGQIRLSPGSKVVIRETRAEAP